jgi:hypothetical protein
MQNQIFDQYSAAEIRADRMAEAEAYKIRKHILKKGPAIKLFCTLGVLLEKWGVSIQNRYNDRALQEKRQALAS